jgi:hypothetical protein
MPKGPQGQKRPADAIGAAVTVAKIATGEMDEHPKKNHGSAGGKARARTLGKKRKIEIAKKGASRRWKKDRPDVSAETSEHHPSE